ncbi:hypothetical protein L484_008710 [Morus notabilis]|uniref:Uncharacterized protein n=1 Tax=Morus notabilis TaxID=981085 RepID=W9RB89_9ROSA|nr:hypothetical protein L484_008710 [Morus notabilis]
MSYKNLMTPENVPKNLLDDIPALSSPSLHAQVPLPFNHAIFPESLRFPKAKRRRISNILANPSTEKHGSIARIEFKSSTLQTAHDQSNPPPFDQLQGLTVPVDVVVLDSSSSESSVQIVDEAEKGPSSLYKDDLIFKQAKRLLFTDERKRMEELGFSKTLQKGISYSAKAIFHSLALEMMLTSFAQSESEFKSSPVSKQEEPTLQKAQIADLD